MKCKNCGATLVYDSSSSMLECRHCDSKFDPNDPELVAAQSNFAEEHKFKFNRDLKPKDETPLEELPGLKDEKFRAAVLADVEKYKKKNGIDTPAEDVLRQALEQHNEKKQAEEAKLIEQNNKEIEYNKYICKSCGAELVGTYETSAIGFCSYCGGENLIKSRIETSRPDEIIPFTKTKEDCKQEYLSTVNSLWFVPSELKDENYIDEIRGIYVPYNIYKTKHDGKLDVAVKNHDSSYDYTYNLKGTIHSENNIPIDGSTQLDDYIGSCLPPIGDPVRFNENYLATYYAELPDSKDEDYYQSLKEDTLENEINTLKKREFKQYDSIEDNREVDEEKVTLSGKKVILNPLYFLTYRKKEKVCYTILSGNKDNYSIYSEIPVNIKPYMLSLFAVALAIWAIMSLIPFIPTFSHDIIIDILSVMAIIVMFLHSFTYRTKIDKHLYMKEKGEKLKSHLKNVVLLFLIFMAILMAICMLAYKVQFVFDIKIVFLLMLAYNCYDIFSILGKAKENDLKVDVKQSFIVLISAFAITILGLIAKLFSIPDEILYIAMSVISIVEIVGFLGLIKVFNDSCERELPHFTREGGHNEAKDL